MPNIHTLICIISYFNVFIGFLQVCNVCKAEITPAKPATFNKFDILQKRAIKSGVNLDMTSKGIISNLE